MLIKLLLLFPLVSQWAIHFFYICEHIRINECYQIKKLLSGYRINESGPVICLILVYTEQPQIVLEPVSVSMETNVSANVSWPFPGGNVMTYLLVLTERRSQISMNFSVNGTELSRVVVGLRPSTTYDVVIITINDLGPTMASPLSSFNTDRECVANPPFFMVCKPRLKSMFPLKSIMPVQRQSLEFNEHFIIIIIIIITIIIIIIIIIIINTTTHIHIFLILGPPEPVITINPLSGPYESGSDIALTCTSPDGSRPIEWTKRDSPALEAPLFEITGVNLVSTLTIKDARESNTGTYICTVGLTKTEVEIEVFTPTTS